MKLDDIFFSKTPGFRIGFKEQGGPSSPFIRYCRYLYREGTNFPKAFASWEAELINEIDIYPAGIISIQHPNGREENFIVNTIITSMKGKQIRKRDFNAVVKNFKIMGSRARRHDDPEDTDKPKTSGLVYEKNGFYRRIKPVKIAAAALTWQEKTLQSELYQELKYFTDENGKEIFDAPHFYALLSDYLEGEFRKEVLSLKLLAEMKIHLEIQQSKNIEETRTAIMQKISALPEFDGTETDAVVDILCCLYHVTL